MSQLARGDFGAKIKSTFAQVAFEVAFFPKASCDATFFAPVLSTRGVTWEQKKACHNSPGDFGGDFGECRLGFCAEVAPGDFGAGELCSCAM